MEYFPGIQCTNADLYHLVIVECVHYEITELYHVALMLTTVLKSWEFSVGLEPKSVQQISIGIAGCLHMCPK